MKTSTRKDYEGRPTHNRTPAPERTFKAPTTNKSNKTVSNIIYRVSQEFGVILQELTEVPYRTTFK
jgi:hypothetical protein